MHAACAGIVPRRDPKKQQFKNIAAAYPVAVVASALPANRTTAGFRGELSNSISWDFHYIIYHIVDLMEQMWAFK